MGFDQGHTLELILHLYPSRFRDKTALGPSQTDPSIRGVKWVPRNGNRGSGTLSSTREIITKNQNRIQKYSPNTC